MRLHVRLVDHVDTILVADIIHARVVRVMRHAQRIDIESFHQLHILLHPFVGHHTSKVRVNLVAVHSSELNRLAIDQEACDTVASLLQLHLAEARLVAFVLHHLARSILQGQDHRIEGRGLGRPAVRRFHIHLEGGVHLPAIRTDLRQLLRNRGEDLLTRRIIQA